MLKIRSISETLNIVSDFFNRDNNDVIPKSILQFAIDIKVEPKNDLMFKQICESIPMRLPGLTIIACGSKVSPKTVFNVLNSKHWINNMLIRDCIFRFERDIVGLAIKALEKNSALETLFIEKAHINMEEFAKFLAQDRMLKSIGFRDLKKLPEWNLLVVAIEQNIHLQTVKIECSTCNENVKKKIEMLIQRNRKIKMGLRAECK